MTEPGFAFCLLARSLRLTATASTIGTGTAVCPGAGELLSACASAVADTTAMVSPQRSPVARAFKLRTIMTLR